MPLLWLPHRMGEAPELCVRSRFFFFCVSSDGIPEHCSSGSFSASPLLLLLSRMLQSGRVVSSCLVSANPKWTAPYPEYGQWFSGSVRILCLTLNQWNFLALTGPCHLSRQETGTNGCCRFLPTVRHKSQGNGSRKVKNCWKHSAGFRIYLEFFFYMWMTKW